jgi:hypothetical protein
MLVGNGAVDTQHGAGGEGSSHPCTKGYYPKEGIFLYFIATHTLLLVVCVVNMVLVLFIFFFTAG